MTDYNTFPIQPVTITGDKVAPVVFMRYSRDSSGNKAFTRCQRAIG
jgi:hypothetical protein